jgi:hypothetical protein
MFLVLRTLVYVTSRSSAHSTPPGLVIREPRHYKHPTPPGLKMSKLQRPPRARRAVTQQLSQVCQCGCTCCRRAIRSSGSSVSVRARRASNSVFNSKG